MRVLGIDLGMARTGLALSDELGLSTRPLPNLTPKSRKQDVDFLVELCATEGVEHVAVGLPLMPRSGDDGFMAKRARGFAAVLQDALRAVALPTLVHLVDERGSSSAAQRRLVESGIKKGRRAELIDSEAARVLVEELIARLQYASRP